MTSSSADRKRLSRQRRLALGKCAECGEPSDYGYYCLRCSRARSGTIARCVQHWRASLDFLALWSLLAENRCIECGELKDRFHPLRHPKCKPHPKAA